jgi:hypothetical protein
MGLSINNKYCPTFISKIAELINESALHDIIFNDDLWLYQ